MKEKITESSCDLALQNCEEDVQIIQSAVRPEDADIWQHLKAKQNERKKNERTYTKER